MKKNINDLHIYNTAEVFKRLSRELRRFGAGSADRLADIVDVFVLSNCWMAPVVAWAASLCREEMDDEAWETEHFATKDSVSWEDRYASCCLIVRDNIELWFNTSGNHGLRIVVDPPRYDTETDSQFQGTIEVIADNLRSERFWGDDEGGLDEDGNASVQVVEAREACFIKSLSVDDNEFADREAKARIEWKERAARPQPLPHIAGERPRRGE